MKALLIIMFLVLLGLGSIVQADNSCFQPTTTTGLYLIHAKYFNVPGGIFMQVFWLGSPTQEQLNDLMQMPGDSAWVGYENGGFTFDATQPPQYYILHQSWFDYKNCSLVWRGFNSPLADKNQPAWEFFDQNGVVNMLQFSHLNVYCDSNGQHCSIHPSVTRQLDKHDFLLWTYQ